MGTVQLKGLRDLLYYGLAKDAVTYTDGTVIFFPDGYIPIKQKIEDLSPKKVITVSFVYADSLEVPGDPKHPAFMDSKKAIELKYRSHLFEVINSVKCEDDAKEFPARMLKAIEEHPEEVNDVCFHDGIAMTVLMVVISKINVELAKAMLDKGAIPFPYERGTDIIDMVSCIYGGEIKPEIIDMIHRAQQKYELNKMILKSEN